MKKHRILFIVTIVTFIAGMILECMKPVVLGRLADALNAKDFEAGEHYFLLLCILQGKMFLSWRFFEHSLIFFESKVMRLLDMRGFATLQRMSMRFFENAFAGSLVKQCTRFRGSFETLYDVSFFEVLKVVMTVGIALYAFYEKDGSFGSMLLKWTLVFCAFTAVAHALKGPLDDAAAAADSELSGALSDSLSNHMTVMAYGREEEEQRYIDGLAERAHRTRLHSWWAAVTADIVMGIMTGFLQIWTAWECFKGIRAGTISIGDFATYQSYVALIGMNLWNFSRALRRLSVATSEATEMAENCFVEPEITDAPGAKALAVTSGRIEFRNIGFRYSDDDTQELNVNLSIASGESIAFVGPSGAGKTTLVKLLLRMYEPQKGSIYIDGQDIRSVTQRSLRQSMASVMQDPALFHRTLRENIAFARPDATDEMIIAAAKKAHAWNFIKRMKDGLDTVVGERGVKLSGGQRQRITLARAFLSDARIIILDEATNALDSMTEKFVQQAIKALLHEGKTCIVIAHRLSTIMEANRIVVMKEGRIVEQGTHGELLAEEKGLYRTLWDHQSYGCIGEEVETE